MGDCILAIMVFLFFFTLQTFTHMHIHVSLSNLKILFFSLAFYIRKKCQVTKTQCSVIEWQRKKEVTLQENKLKLYSPVKWASHWQRNQRTLANGHPNLSNYKILCRQCFSPSSFEASVSWNSIGYTHSLILNLNGSQQATTFNMNKLFNCLIWRNKATDKGKTSRAILNQQGLLWNNCCQDSRIYCLILIRSYTQAAALSRARDVRPPTKEIALLLDCRYYGLFTIHPCTFSL